MSGASSAVPVKFKADAIAILLSFIEFPIMPAASFLKLDIALVPAAVVGFAYGAGPGILVGIVFTAIIISAALQIPNLPATAVVETNAVFCRDSIRPVEAGAVSGDLLALLTPHIRNHELTYQAARTCDMEPVVQAFLNDPLVKGHDCSEEEVRALVRDMIRATSRYLPKEWKV